MDVERERQLLRIRDAETDDLIAEATVFRPGMEAVALRSIDAELRERGVTSDDLIDYVQERPNLLIDKHGLPWQCHFCMQPAEREGWGWHWMWGKVPLFPRWFRWCRTHAPQSKSREQEGESS